VSIGLLDQGFSQLADIADDRVLDVLGRYRQSFVVEKKELTPAQMLERRGFSRAHLTSRVVDLSGGQKRRLQLLLVLMAEPNVLILDEPTNDVDTDMLQALEDVLDSYPGTLIVISHDRYFIERVTDQQYAIFDGHFRSTPGGVDQYLELEAAREHRQRPPQAKTSTSSTSAQDRAQRKQLSAVERKIDQANRDEQAALERMSQVAGDDYHKLQELSVELENIRSRRAELEETWLQLAENLDI
jgi:ABC-type multidrug transport system ATPase subunit